MWKRFGYRAAIEAGVREGVAEGMQRSLGPALERALMPVRAELHRLRSENRELRSHLARVRAVAIAHGVPESALTRML